MIKTEALLVIVGETGSGKSALALDIAQRFNGEIISADSWQVYRGFDIGTAKPSKAEQAAIPHHMIDIVNAPDGFNAALFKDLAQSSIKQIHSRGKLPMLVGGTGLYVDSVLFDYGFLPTVDPDVRAARNIRGLADLHNEAKELGIDLSGIDAQNKRRVIRALETNGQQPSNTSLRPNTLVVGLQISRDELRRRITERVDKMIKAGLETEVITLVQKYGWDVEPMKGIGYREWREHLDGSQTLDETKTKIINASMKLAKRQRTWLRSPRYNKLPDSDLPFPAKTNPVSLDVAASTSPEPEQLLTRKSSDHNKVSYSGAAPKGMSHSPETVLTQKSSDPNKSTYQSVGIERNNSIHWLDDPLKAVSLVTKFLNNKQ